MRVISDCLKHFQQLPFILSAGALSGSDLSGHGSALLSFETPAGEGSGVLHQGSAAVIRALLPELKREDGPVFYFSEFIADELRSELKQAGVNYIDRAGNCWVQLGQQYLALIEGRQRAEPARRKELRSAALRVLFGFMADPELPGNSLRYIAERVGTSTMAVRDMKARLKEDGVLLKRGGVEFLSVSDVLLDQWWLGYREILRPGLFIDSYKLPEGREPKKLERLFNHVFGQDWSWGGAVAASTLPVTPHYGHPWTVHLPVMKRVEVPRLPFQPDPGGELHVVGIPGPLAWKNSERSTVHPLLVYAELMSHRSDRFKETAYAVRDVALGQWSET